MTTLRNAIGNIGTALAALALVLAAPLAWAQSGAKNSVDSINFSQVQGGKIIVKVGMKEALAAVPQGFTVSNPPRIAIDLPDTANGLNRNQIEAGEGDLKSVSIVQTGNRTRLVMNLARTLTYTQAVDGNQLVGFGQEERGFAVGRTDEEEEILFACKVPLEDFGVIRLNCQLLRPCLGAIDANGVGVVCEFRAEALEVRFRKAVGGAGAVFGFHGGEIVYVNCGSPVQDFDAAKEQTADLQSAAGHRFEGLHGL